MKQSPLLLVLIGLPGAGKTSLARALAPLLPAVIVDRDAIRARCCPGAAANAQTNAVANAEMAREIGQRLRAGANVIADGRSYALDIDRCRMAELALAAGARVRFIWLDVSLELAEWRVTQSRAAHPASDRTPRLVQEVAARFEDVEDRALQLDGSLPVEMLADKVLHWLD